VRVAPGAAVRRVLSIGRLPSDDSDPDCALLGEWQSALDAVDSPVTEEEAVALVGCLPPDESTAFGLAWTLVHIIESAAIGPAFIASLDERSWWTMQLRDRLNRRARG
jgi:hypothetical protein